MANPLLGGFELDQDLGKRSRHTCSGKLLVWYTGVGIQEERLGSFRSCQLVDHALQHLSGVDCSEGSRCMKACHITGA